jgi:hypothetical protein
MAEISGKWCQHSGFLRVKKMVVRDYPNNSFSMLALESTRLFLVEQRLEFDCFHVF